MAIAIKDIVCTKGNDVSRWQNMMRATFHHPSDIEIVCVQKRSNGDAKQLLATYLFLQCLFEKMLLDGLLFRNRCGTRTRIS